MNKTLILLILLIGILLISFILFHQKNIFKEKIDSFEECLSAGYPVMESYPRQCMVPNGKSFTEDIGNELEKQDLIRINNPRPNSLIVGPLEIQGEARGFWFFEGDFPIKLVDNEGRELGRAMAKSSSSWMTEEFISFEAVLEFSVPAVNKGKLILEKDNPSGLPENEDQLIVPVYFNLNKTTKVKLYFLNDSLDPGISCNKVFSVEREIFKTQALARRTLEELLKGPDEEEKAEGYSTSINSGVKIQNLAIEDGAAKVDFNEQLEFGLGGACLASAIRVQITETLKQFPTVEKVIISINGRTEDILQP